jgi:hypothetical protein
LHPQVSGAEECPPDALTDPFRYLPPPVEFTPRMNALAEPYIANANEKIDFRYYPAYQAAAFLKPRTFDQHRERQEQFAWLKSSAEAQGFAIPDSLTRLFMTDAFIDRLHHGNIWPTVPKQIVRLPADPRFAVLLFLYEGQGCGFWHVLLAPDGTHTIINASDAFGSILGYPTAHEPDCARFTVSQCMDCVNRLLYHYFSQSARDDKRCLERLEEYFADHPE